jgi:hypothetical protein
LTRSLAPWNVTPQLSETLAMETTGLIGLKARLVDLPRLSVTSLRAARGVLGHIAFSRFIEEPLPQNLVLAKCCCPTRSSRRPKRGRAQNGVRRETFLIPMSVRTTPFALLTVAVGFNESWASRSPFEGPRK